jgi:CRP/FNR family transcriptional regulator
MQLSSLTLSKLKEVGTVKTFSEGDVIMNEHAYIRAIPIVLNGSIRVMRSDDEGGEILLYYIRPGESCIMSFMGSMNGQPSMIKAIAEEDVEILFVPVEHSSTLIKESSEWLDYIFGLYNKRFEELLEVVNAVTFKKTDERILHFLQEKKELSNSNDISITHQQLADELGTVRVVVSRLLKQMEADGLVKLGRNKISLM